MNVARVFQSGSDRAIRLPDELLGWNATEGKFLHHAKANALLTKAYRKGFEPKWLA
jgi:hypothetical protein